ncbi:MAG: ROK family transcriptional regulator [Sphaerochaeta sp.]|nr:ROK family transcriptional regulator [Sphaerochaeta sp.]
MNYKTVLDTIRTQRSVSRAELSRLTGLTRSTCSVICDRMLTQGIIIENGTIESTGGRPSIALQINNRAASVLGLKMMEGHIAAATVDLGGNIIIKHSQSIEPDLSSDAYLKRFEAFVTAIITQHNTAFPLIPMLGIGIGVGGRVSSDGVLLESSVLGWRNVALKQRLQERFALPVHIENDVNTFAIGEKFFGSGQLFDNFLCLSVGEGIGLGIVVNGKLLAGSHHGAGELGHTRVSYEPDSPRCACGKRGCLEAFASDAAVGQRYFARTGKKLGIDALLAAAEAGDEDARTVFSQMGTYLGIAVSSLVNLFDPEAVIIGGERTNAASHFMKDLRRAFEENTVYDLAREVQLIVLEPSNDEWIRGVAALAIGEFFSQAKRWGQ